MSAMCCPLPYTILFMVHRCAVVLSNPNPLCSVLLSVDYEDGITVGNPDTLVLESNLLLGQDLEFGEADFKIIGFDRDSGRPN